MRDVRGLLDRGERKVTFVLVRKFSKSSMVFTTMSSIGRILSPRLTSRVILNNARCASTSSSSSPPTKASGERDFVDIPTHTGQTFEEEDYRLARFEGRSKLVVSDHAINLIDEVPPKPVKERWVWCEGGGGPLGHPKVFINLDQPGNHACGYCGLRFFQEGHDSSHGH